MGYGVGLLTCPVEYRVLVFMHGSSAWGRCLDSSHGSGRGEGEGFVLGARDELGVCSSYASLVLRLKLACSLTLFRV